MSGTREHEGRFISIYKMLNTKYKIKIKNTNQMSGTREREGRCVDENDLYQSSNSGISDMIWALMLWYVHWYYDTYVHWYYDMSINIMIWALISNILSMESFYMINDITCGHAFVNFPVWHIYFDGNMCNYDKAMQMQCRCNIKIYIVDWVKIEVYI